MEAQSKRSTSCTYDCHGSTRARKFNISNRLFGRLLIGYSGTPITNLKCNKIGCLGQPQRSLIIVYCFPTWFLARIIQVVMETHCSGDPTMSISLRRRVDIDTGCLVNNYARNGDIDAFKALFSERVVLPNDLNWVGYTALHVRLSTISNHTKLLENVHEIK